MLLDNKKIAIIGGGPGGLTLAKLLQRQGVNVKVYERDLGKDARIQGGALDLHTESGLAALTKAGLMDAFKTHYQPGAELMRITDNQATIHFDEHQAGRTVNFGDKDHRPEIDRGPLRDILLDSLDANTVVWDSKFQSMQKLADGWEIFFDNGNSTYADIVIGADGSSSKIRPYLTDIKPIWSGITMIEGAIKNAAETAPNIHKLLRGGKIFAFGNDKTLIVSSKGDGSFGFTTGCKTDEDWVENSGIDFKDNKQVLAWFKKEYAEWSSIWWELFDYEKTLFIPRPQYCMPLDQKWATQSNLTLLGDAAHWMPPFAGEGVNMAMLDALELSESLTNPAFKDSQTAIASYEKKMLKRFAKSGQETMFNTKWMHTSNAMNDMMSIFSTNLLKTGIFMGKMFVNVVLMPFVRKTVGLSPKY
jgi:2-polyprenyl-6-methoxyphenol hydroxylase-like FAD-dependent oxidoreductase